MQKFLRTLTLLALLSVPWVAQGQMVVTIGNGTSTTYVTPFNSLWGYSFVESIYTSSEINMAGTITSIKYYFATAAASMTHDVTVYMKNVTQSTFAAETDYVPVTAADIVYQGQMTIPADTGWVTIQLTTPFAYDGASNLMIAFHENTPGYSSRYFRYTSTPNSVVSFHSDSYDPDPYNLDSYSGNSYDSPNRANIQLVFTPLSGYCPVPGGLHARDITATSAVIGWSIASIFDNVGSINIEYGPRGFTSGTGTAATVDGDSAVLTGLTPGTYYQVYGVTDCNNDGYSDTVSITFFTPSLPYSDLPYYTGFEEDDDLSWSINNGHNGWYIDTAAKSTGDYGLYISADTGRTNTYVHTLTNSFAARNFVLDSGKYAIGFDWRCQGESSSYDYLHVYLAPGSTDMTAPSLPFESWTSISSNINLKSTWQTIGLEFDVPADGEYYIVFRWYNDNGGGSNPPAAVDNVELHALSCPMPSGLMVENVGITNATLSWHPGAEEEEWAVSVNGSEWHQVFDTIVTIDTLRDNTPNTFRVKAVCGDGDSSFVLTANATTLRYCYSVTGITASNIGFTSVGLSWTPSSNGNAATAVTISLTSDDSTVTTLPAPQTVTGTSVLFSGLQPATSYTAHFATTCDEHDAIDTLTLTFSTSACGEVTGTTTITGAPFMGNYNYGYSQVLYDASLVSGIDSITGISYEISTVPSSYPVRTVDVYMGYTTLTSLSTSNYVPVSQLTKVATDASIDVSQVGWTTINFGQDSAFHPNGNGNLVVAVVNKTGHYYSITWKAKDATTGSAIYWYRDSNGEISPANPTSGSPTSGTAAKVPNTRFLGNCDLNRCMASNVSVTDITTTSIEVAWVPNGSESSWVLRYRPIGGEWVDESNAITASPYTVSGLTPGIGYEFALGSLCGDETVIDTLWSTTTGYTECALGTLPYSNYFNASLGPCWTVTSVTRTTSNLLSFSGATSRAILPELPLQDVMIMMSLRGTANGGLKLGVTEDNGQNVTWLDTVAIASSSDLNTVTSTLNGYNGEATRLVLAPVQGTTSVYIDFIIIDVNTGCTPVENVTVSNLTANTATISWSSEQTSFNVSYRAIGDSLWIDTVVSEDSIVFETLTSLTSYEVRVRPGCSQDSAFWMTISFSTPCAIYTPPFFENFSTTINACWSRYTGLFGSGTPTTTTSGWQSSTTAPFTDGHYKVNIYGTSCKYWLVTPYIQLGEQVMELGFDAALTAYNASTAAGTDVADDKFIVAVSANDGAWTPVATWGSASTNTYTFSSIPRTGARYTVDLSAYANQTIRIAFYGESTVSGSDNDLRIDNISVMRGGCGVPDSLTLDTATFTSATLHWQDTTTIMTDYEVVYGTVNNIEDSNNVHINVGVPTITLTGLTNNTRYYVWVRTVCDDFSSTWTNSINFTTPRSCFSPNSVDIANVGYTTANFSWGFNDAQVATGLPITGVIVRIVNESDTTAAEIVQTVTDNHLIIGGLTPSTNYRVYLTTVCDPDTTTAVSFPLSTVGCAEESTGGFNIGYMPFYGYYNYGYSQSIYPSEILQYMDTIRGISYKINSVPSSYTTRPVSVYLGHTNRTSLDTNSYVPVDSLQLMVTNFQMDLSQTGWTTIIFDTFFVYDGTSDILVAVDNNTGSYSSFDWMGHQVDGYKGVYWYRDGSDIDPANPNAGTVSHAKYNLLPDVRFEGNCLLGTCLPPMLVIDSVSATEAYASLMAGGDDDTWVVQYRLYGTDTWISTPASTLTSRIINGLQHSTLYQFRAGSLCGSDTMWARTIEHYTECAPVDVPLVENFDNGISPCWMDTLTTTYINSTTGDMYIYLGGKKSFLKTAIINAAVDTLQVRVNMRASTAGQQLRVGVADEDGNNVEWLDSIAAQSTTVFNEEVLFIHNYSGTDRTNRRIVLAPAGTANYYYVTDVIVEPLMPCLPIRDLHVIDSLTTGDSIVLDWTDLQTAGSWAVEYGVEGFTRGTGTTVNVTAHPAAIAGLSSSTTYHFYVTPVCTADSGFTAGPVRATTSFVPCNEAEYVNVGSETSTGTSSYYPVNNYYKYTLTETIIDSAELGGPKNIAYIAYYYNYSTAMTQKTNVDIYIQPTTKSVFSSTSDYDTLTDAAVLVYHGNLNCQQGWNYFTLTDPYEYDGQTNLMVIVDDNSGAYNTSSYVFKTQSTTGYKTLYRYSDSNDPDVHNFGTFSGTTSRAQSRVVMQLIGCGDMVICHAPTVDTVSATHNTVTVNFNGNADAFEVAIVEGNWEDPSTGIPAYGTYTFTGLESETQYFVGVRSNCGTGNYSNWVVRSITTDERPCAVPTNLVASNVTLNSATLGWTNGEEGQSAWQIHITGEGYDQTHDVTTNPFTVTGLAYGVTYTFTVRAVCSETNISAWSAPATFTTVACESVTGVTVGSVTANSAVISWTAPTGATRFVVNYGFQGFDQGTGSFDTVENATSCTLSGLTANTPYDVYVRTLCEGGTASAWSSVVNFTTSRSTGIDDVNAANVSLYPNPASSTVTLKGIEGKATVTVVDMNGRKAGEWTVNEGELTIDVTDMAQGAYFVRIVGEQVNAIRKLIVR